MAAHQLRIDRNHGRRRAVYFPRHAGRILGFAAGGAIPRRWLETELTGAEATFSIEGESISLGRIYRDLTF